MPKPKQKWYICKGHAICKGNADGSCPHGKMHRWNSTKGDAYLGCFAPNPELNDIEECDCVETTKLKVFLEKL